MMISFIAPKAFVAVETNATLVVALAVRGSDHALTEEGAK
jgi:hypothetical protein